MAPEVLNEVARGWARPASLAALSSERRKGFRAASLAHKAGLRAAVRRPAGVGHSQLVDHPGDTGEAQGQFRRLGRLVCRANAAFQPDGAVDVPDSDVVITGVAAEVLAQVIGNLLGGLLVSCPHCGRESSQRNSEPRNRQQASHVLFPPTNHVPGVQTAERPLVREKAGRARLALDHRRVAPLGNIRIRSLPDYRFRSAGCAGRKKSLDFAAFVGCSGMAQEWPERQKPRQHNDLRFRLTGRSRPCESLRRRRPTDPGHFGPSRSQCGSSGLPYPPRGRR